MQILKKNIIFLHLSILDVVNQAIFVKINIRSIFFAPIKYLHDHHATLLKETRT